MADYYGEEDYDFHADMNVHRGGQRRRRPSPHYNGNMLNAGLGANLQRSRSQGHGPAPTINVYNRLYNDNEQGAPPYPPARTPPRRVSPEYRGRAHRLGDDIVEDLAEMALEDRRFRSRSRGRSDAPVYVDNTRQAMAEWELAQRNAQLDAQLREDARKAEWELAQKTAQLAEDARKADWEREERRIKDKYKLHSLEEQLKHEHDADAAKDRERRFRIEYETKMREQREKQAEEERRIKDKLERGEREARERHDRELQEIMIKQKEEKERKDRERQEILRAEKEANERKAREEKEAEERFLQKQREKKEKAEREEKEAEERFLKKQREKKEKEEKEKKEAEEKFQAEMRKRLAAMGYTEKTIEMLVDEEKAKKFKEEVQVKQTEIDIWRGPHRSPVYPKIHRDYLSIETLKYYGLPWEYDRSNSDYIIILRDMDKRETDVLFEHTTRLRTGNLLLEPKKKEKEFAWYRKRSHSRGAPSRVGILELRR